MRLLAPAKINLHLRVGPPAGDGVHPIVSWMCTVGLFDTLEIQPAEDSVDTVKSDRPLVALTCDDPAVPCDESNLVARAANALIGPEGLVWRAAHPTRSSLMQARVHLGKRIPSGAGLGGGSSDAARAALGLNRFWKIGLAPRALSEELARVGSDVPFFLGGGSSVCTGRGDVVVDVPRPVGAMWALLVLPDIHMPTPRVYRRFDEMGLGESSNISAIPPWQEWTKLSARELLRHLVNDLEPAAFDIDPRLSELRRGVERALDRTVRMSGSGSSLFTLFDDEAEAQRASGDARAFGARVEVVQVAPIVHDDASN